MTSTLDDQITDYLRREASRVTARVSLDDIQLGVTVVAASSQHELRRRTLSFVLAAASIALLIGVATTRGNSTADPSMHASTPPRGSDDQASPASPSHATAAPPTVEVLETAQPYSVFLSAMLQGRSLTSIHDEEQKFIADCMAERGFNYEPVPYGVVDQSPDFTASIASLRRYREAYGYGVNTPPSAVLDNPNAPMLAALSEPEEQAFYSQLVGGTEATGPDPDSCTSRAQAQVRNGLPYFDPTYAAVFDDYLGRLEADPRFVAGIEQWSACMHASGYDVVHPDDMTDYASANFQGSPELELRAARIDQDCYERTLAAVRPLVDAKILTTLVNEVKQVLTSSRGKSG